MKRSEVDAILDAAARFVSEHGFVLPPFARWTPRDWQDRADAAAHLVAARCGWDVTDYGAGRFAQMGLTLFTLRNGRLADLRRGGGMCYAEKLLICRRGQLSPMHTHRIKAEDIIVRGGAPLIVELYGADATGAFDAAAGGTVMCDGVPRDFGPGTRLRLQPGESVTLMPGDWHAFWSEDGDTLVGEVSTVNDDETDNVFREPIGRFATVTEDAPARHLLVSDYAARLG